MVWSVFLFEESSDQSVHESQLIFLGESGPWEANRCPSLENFGKNQPNSNLMALWIIRLV